MSAYHVIRRMVPGVLRAKIRQRLTELIRHCKTPRMNEGHQDSSGAWRPLTRISDTVAMTCPERIRIEDNVFVGHYVVLDGTGGLTIGEGCHIASSSCIYTHSSHIAIRLYGRHYREVPEGMKEGYIIKPVAIGRYSFVGAGALILPGVSVGKGAVVGAGAVVTRNVGDFQVVSGHPARVVNETQALDKDYLDDPQLREWYEEWQDIGRAERAAEPQGKLDGRESRRA